MADCESKSQHRKMKKMKTKKRKQHSTDKKEEGCKRPSKSHRTDRLAGEVEETIVVPGSEEAIKLHDYPPWRNLQLILSLQNNSILLQESVLIFHCTAIFC